MSAESPQFVVIGGGTGNFTVLSGLKSHGIENLTAVVGMADDGGSTGVLRDEYGVLPPGDIRQCLIALSDAPQSTRETLQHRFEEGVLKGHVVGNVLITAALEIGAKKGDLNAAYDNLNDTFRIKGRVLPATLDDRRLRVTTLDGQVIDGEHAVEETKISSLRGAKVGFTVDPTSLNERAEAAIKEADMVIIAPGDLYTSIAPALAVRGMKGALRDTRQVVQVANLMNRNHHTVGFSVSDYASEIERIVGMPVLDHVLYNTEQPHADALQRYAAEKKYLVGIDERALKRAAYEAIGRPLLSHIEAAPSSADALAQSRSLVWHDQGKIARSLLGIYWSNAA